MNYVGKDFDRIDAQDKVKGLAVYTDDIAVKGALYAKAVLSTVPHADIVKINKEKALNTEGVIAVITGEDNMVLCGPCIKDRPPIAYGRVRYYGEPVALVVAYDEQTAEKAARLVEIQYSELLAIDTVDDALKEGAFLIHNVNDYAKVIEDVFPQANTNICHITRIRKGDAEKAFSECEFVAEGEYYLPHSDHIAMETRAAVCEIKGDGYVRITTSSQSPFEIKKQLCEAFKLDGGKVDVTVPLVGGAFGGKSAVQLEILAYIASMAAGGRAVKVVNTREQDMIMSPCRMGLKAKIKLGADKDGMLKAAHCDFMLDTGAYADIGPRLAQAVAVDCTGAYKIDNVYCDSMAIYTNHTYVTAYRGFGHESLTFCIERTMEKLANAANTDALELRTKNLVKYGDTTPTQVALNENNLSDITQCYEKLKTLIDWHDNGKTVGTKVLSWGLSSFCKTSNSPTDAVSGAIITFNSDGSINLNVGIVEFGQAAKTRLVKILADTLKVNPDRIRINTEVNTQFCPEHWKTVASLTTFLAGKAVIKAAEDVVKQFKELAAVSLRCAPEELDIEDERVFVKYNKEFFIAYKDLVRGLKFFDGTNIGGQIIGRGGYGLNHLTKLAPDTGKGKPGSEWTCGAQAVLVEYDNKEQTFRVLKAVTVIDAGTLISPGIDIGVIKGGMSMGLGLAMHEAFSYDNGRIKNTSLRTYKVRHKEDIPVELTVEFVNTPNVESPCGARAFSEHGVIGIPAALANAISRAAGVETDTLPIYPETIWKLKGGENASV
ncbi:MAG TPA: xanthine dehydrogenase family protein molybdopterin-binding subunit [Clostridia bacterium]|nr:xanthine dehydrogenase family protein molybdopterin-binding subunit [Clostridia bacterium]